MLCDALDPPAVLSRFAEHAGRLLDVGGIAIKLHRAVVFIPRKSLGGDYFGLQRRSARRARTELSSIGGYFQKSLPAEDPLSASVLMIEESFRRRVMTVLESIERAASVASRRQASSGREFGVSMRAAFREHAAAWAGFRRLQRRMVKLRSKVTAWVLEHERASSVRTGLDIRVSVLHVCRLFQAVERRTIARHPIFQVLLPPDWQLAAWEFLLIEGWAGSVSVMGATRDGVDAGAVDVAEIVRRQSRLVRNLWCLEADLQPGEVRVRVPPGREIQRYRRGRIELQKRCQSLRMPG